MLARSRRMPSLRTYRIADRRGRFLADVERVPFSWTEREMTALSFPSRDEAERFAQEKFVGEAGRRLLGLRVVP